MRRAQVDGRCGGRGGHRRRWWSLGEGQYQRCIGVERPGLLAVGRLLRVGRQMARDRASSENREQRLHTAEVSNGIGPAGERQDPAPAATDPTSPDVEPVKTELLELVGVVRGRQEQEL